jgi:hypothetical protein
LKLKRSADWAPGSKRTNNGKKKKKKEEGRRTRRTRRTRTKTRRRRGRRRQTDRKNKSVVGKLYHIPSANNKFNTSISPTISV